MTQLEISQRTDRHAPIACTLGPGDHAQRLALMSALGADALVDARRDGAHAQLRFVADAGIRERLVAIASAEQECCAFLTMSVEDEPGRVKLTIDGPTGAAPVVEDLVDAFSRSEASGPVPARRGASKTVGKGGAAMAGAGFLMVLCCAAGPAVIGAVAGGVIGGWLGIGAAVVVAAGIGVALQRRRRTKSTCGC